MTVTRGVRNNNPGNIERGEDWQGLASISQMTPAQKKETRFAVFSDPVYGIRALAKLLMNYQAKYGLNTVHKMINRWAPPVENDTGAYVNAVAKAAGVAPDAVVSMRTYSTARGIVDAIIAHENAGYVYPAEVVDKGLSLAGITV